jgi:transposase
MSTSLLYHAFGVRGYRQLRETFQDGQVIFHIEQPRERHRCSNCGLAEVWDQGGVDRTFRTVSIGAKPAFVQLKVPRVLCFECGLVRRRPRRRPSPGRPGRRSRRCRRARPRPRWRR